MEIDLAKILVPSLPPLEIVVRGTIMYLALVLLIRVIFKRQSLGLTDLLVIVLIADAAQNGMAGEYTSVADGLLLVATIISWAYALDWLGYHVPAIERLIQPSPLPLIERGKLVRRNMRAELVTIEELKAQLRLEGIEEIAEVERAWLEGDGELSVVRKGEGSRRRKSKPGAAD